MKFFSKSILLTSLIVLGAFSSLSFKVNAEESNEPDCLQAKNLFEPSPVFQTFVDIPFILLKVQEIQQNPTSLFQVPLSPFTSWYKEVDQRAGLAKLAVMRGILDQFNLWNTYLQWFPQRPEPCPASAQNNRLVDGSCNDLDNPMMGAVGTRFGHNIALFQQSENPQPQPNPALRERTIEEIISPSPREISRKLMTRQGSGKEIPFLNLLGSAWIQFMIHDWFDHGPNDHNLERAVRIPLAEDDPLKQYQDDLVVLRTPKDQTRLPHENALLGPTFNNVVTHWWDGSQLYGSDKETCDRLRKFEGGHLIVDSKGFAEVASDGFSDTGFRANWWLGLEVIHNLFIKEHNAIADMLAEQYPEMNDEELFNKARLINAALMAKIHTLEWTPAVTPNPVLNMSMNANWAGLNQFLQPQLVQEVPESYAFLPPPFRPIVFGIRGGERDLKTGVDGQPVPFAMTEEFVSVYRMHPLLPEAISIIRQKPPSAQPKSAKRMRRILGSPTKERVNEPETSLMNLRNRKARQTLDRVGLEDLLLTFGIRKSMQLTLKNYPKFLQELTLDFIHPSSGQVPKMGNLSKEEKTTLKNIRKAIPKYMDLAAVDIVRDRERGIPRYNEFRREMRLASLQDIGQITQDPELLPLLRDLYDNDIEKVDLLVGMLGEAERPTCFGFGETAFQVFISVATRRLQGDRFYTDSYNAETYTAEGINWVESNSLKSVILRHFPELEDNSGIKNLKNAFFPWE